MFKNVDVKDLLKRAAWTFLQAFAAVWLVADDPQFSTQALVGAAGAGFSAVKTFVVAWLTSRKV